MVDIVFKRLLKWILLRNSSVVSRPPGQFEICEPRLAALKRNGLTARTAVDAGAADGEWAKMFHRVYPAATVLMR